MALYEDETFQLANPEDEQPDPSQYVLKGKMGPVGAEQNYYEKKGVNRGGTPGQEQGVNAPTGQGIDQDFAFLNTVISKLGYNPYTINPTGDAAKEFQANESRLFSEAFGNTGMSPSTLTPEALKYWNEQKQQLIQQKAAELNAKIVQGKSLIDEVMKRYKERTTITGHTTIDPATGQEVYVNQFGEMVSNPSQPAGAIQEAPTERPKTQTSGQKAEQAVTAPVVSQTGGVVKPKTPKEGKQLSMEAITALADLSTTYDRLEAIEDKMRNNPNVSGPIEGRWQTLKLKFANDGPTQAVQNELKSLITIAYGLSGKQISEKEIKMLQEAMLPTLNQPHQNLMSTIGFARDWVAQTHNKRLDYGAAGGYMHDIKRLRVGPRLVDKFKDKQTGEIIKVFSNGERRKEPGKGGR